MLPTATIVFREILEIALILGVVMAATKGLPNRTQIVLAGLAIGFIGAAFIALFTERISSAIDGVGQEVFNAGIMFVAVGFLSWTVIWMKKHGRELSGKLKKVGQDVVDGRKSFIVLVIVIALATFREGSEIVLFSYGMLASGAFGWPEILAGGAIGALGGTILGFMLYFGLLKAAQKHLFAVTSWMLIILTAGMAAQGAAFLIQAGILPTLIPQVWDTSNILSGHSFVGETLGVLIGYTPRPTGMELAFYATVLAGVGFLYRFMGRPAPQKARVMTPAE
jgi:high-affinity iron transporter